jgi:hypothetical protein
LSGGFAVAAAALSAGSAKIGELGQASDLLGGAVTAGLLDIALAAGQPAAAAAFKTAAQRGAEAFVEAAAVFAQAAQNLRDSGAGYARADESTATKIAAGTRDGAIRWAR